MPTDGPKLFDYTATFQTKMLRTIFQDPDFACSVVGYLDPSLFDGKVKRWLASALFAHVKRYGVGASLDAVRLNLSESVKKKRLSRDDVPEAEVLVAKLKRPVKDRSFVKEETFRFCKNQVSRDAILKSASFLQELDFEGVDREVARILEVNSIGQGSLGHFYVRDLPDRTRRRKEFTPQGFSTGTKLDDYLKAGGLWRKALGCVMAGLGRGKSSTLVSLGAAAILNNGAKVLHVSVELPVEMIVDKYDARFADIPINDLEEETAEIEDVVGGLGRQYGEFLIVKEFPSATLSVPMLRTYMRRLESVPFVPDVVVLDYADECIPSIQVDVDNVTASQGSVYRELRKLAQELNVAVWTAAQVNRSGLDREIIDERFTAGALAKPMISDYFFAICQKPQEKKAKVARLYVIKSRGGPDRFELPVRLDTARSLLTDRT